MASPRSLQQKLVQIVNHSRKGFILHDAVKGTNERRRWNEGSVSEIGLRAYRGLNFVSISNKSKTKRRHAPWSRVDIVENYGRAREHVEDSEEKEEQKTKRIRWKCEKETRKEMFDKDSTVTCNKKGPRARHTILTYIIPILSVILSPFLSSREWRAIYRVICRIRYIYIYILYIWYTYIYIYIRYTHISCMTIKDRKLQSLSVYRWGWDRHPIEDSQMIHSASHGMPPLLSFDHTSHHYAFYNFAFFLPPVLKAQSTKYFSSKILEVPQGFIYLIAWITLLHNLFEAWHKIPVSLFKSWRANFYIRDIYHFRTRTKISISKLLG